ncbi:hypothetical protein [Streptomyces kanasensis]|uniref:hypothetical protein n=1 Tax=Streptomyces kanasensis TaxID=936756 RepID=UPI0037003B13
MSTTPRDLTRRLRWLLLLGTATTLVLFGAFRAVHHDAVGLATASAPGVLAVDTAEHALGQARASVPEDGLQEAGTGGFHTQISVAHQALALAASENVTGLPGRRTLQTATGLISVYSGWIEQANREPDDSALRGAYLLYADRVLDAPGTDEDIMGHLGDLRDEQLAVAERQAGFGWPMTLTWAAAAALTAALLGGLLEAQRFTRRRFRRPVNPPLLAATVLWTAGAAALATVVLGTHGDTTASVGELRDRHTGAGIGHAATTVEGHLADAGLWASLSDGILVAGVALVALSAAGLLPRLTEYRHRERR